MGEFEQNYKIIVDYETGWCAGLYHVRGHVTETRQDYNRVDCHLIVSAYRYIAITQLPIIPVFVEYLG